MSPARAGRPTRTPAPPGPCRPARRAACRAAGGGGHPQAGCRRRRGSTTARKSPASSARPQHVGHEEQHGRRGHRGGDAVDQTPQQAGEVAVPQRRRQAAGAEPPSTKPAPAAPAPGSRRQRDSSGMNTHGSAPARPRHPFAIRTAGPAAPRPAARRPARSPAARHHPRARSGVMPPRRPTRRRRCWPSNSPATPAPAAETASRARPEWPAARPQRQAEAIQDRQPAQQDAAPPLPAPKRSLAQPISGSGHDASTARAASSTPPTRPAAGRGFGMQARHMHITAQRREGEGQAEGAVGQTARRGRAQRASWPRQPSRRARSLASGARASSQMPKKAPASSGSSMRAVSRPWCQKLAPGRAREADQGVAGATEGEGLSRRGFPAGQAALVVSPGGGGSPSRLAVTRASPEMARV